MHQRIFGTAAAGPSTGQAEIAAAVDHLAGEVARLALHIKLTATITDAIEAERVAEAFCVAVSGAPDCKNSQSEHDLAQCDGVGATDPQNPIVPIGSIVPLSATDDSNGAGVGPGDAGPDPVGPKDEIGDGESAIAARILHLHDRLGSFIKP